MNGVEILSQETIYETTYPWWFILIFAGIGLIIGIIVMIINYLDERIFDPTFLFLIGVLVLAGSMIGMLIAENTNHETDTVDHIEYKVTIDDSVSMNELLDKYEILDQEGKIYTVKEKE